MPQSSKNPLFLYVIVLSQFVVPFMFSGVGVTLPSMGHELGASAVSLGLVETIYLGAGAAFLLPMGKLGDVSDKKTLFKIGLCLFTLSTLVIGFLPGIGFIIATRFVQGIAGAMLSATSMAIITDIVPAHRRGQAFGLSIGVVYAGLAIGPLIAGYITQHLSWHWVYWISFVPLAIATVLSLLMLKSRWQAPREPIHILGSVLIVAALMLLIFGGALLSKTHWSYTLLIVGALMLILFVLTELRVRHPLLQFREVIHNSPLSEALVIQLLLYASAFGTTFMFSLYLQTLRGYDAETAGQILIVGSVLMACVAPLSGRFADKYSPRKLSGFGVLSVMVSTILATQIDSATSLSYIVLILLLQGLGFSLFSSPNMAIIMGSVSRSQTSVASALAAKMRSLGMVSSMLIITILLSLLVGSGQLKFHQQAYLSVMTHAFTIFSVCSCLGLLLCFRSMHKGNKASSPADSG
ncbi:MFS transporter [Dongshaea marina]|uniref:MFS transporter n=1 Tax=Dongshaea marina TaxID=2047966 RepID=UPI000D3E4C41|nr:MFS transporter [Dongshaea marina]